MDTQPSTGIAPAAGDPSQPACTWWADSILYHIYPLGFLSAPPENRLDQPVEHRLDALHDWLDHFCALGITCLQIGPLCQSLTHGYDVVDYRTVDRRLGDAGSFRRLVDACHARGLRVILDGVFNHTSREFFAFRDVHAHRRSSRFADWYHLDPNGNSAFNDGFAYQSWEGHQNLPRLNLLNRELREHIFEAACYWLTEMNVDGWRLDVAHEIDPFFWRQFAEACRSARHDCLLLAEAIHGDYRRLVGPELLDTATNYQLSKALWSSLNDRNYFELAHVIQRDQQLYRGLRLVSFLGNHDLSRIRSQLTREAHYFPAIIALLTGEHVPALYYGDECGMEGQKTDGDAALRRPMPRPDAWWPDEQRARFRETARLCEIRREHPVLRHGSYELAGNTHTSFTVVRRLADQTAVICLNSADTPARVELDARRFGLPDGLELEDALEPLRRFTIADGRLIIEPVWPNWGRILLPVVHHTGTPG